MSDYTQKILLLTCDRKEGGVAVLLSDEGDEIKLLPPLSDSICEGSVYRCTFKDGAIVSAERDKSEEDGRRRASAALLKSLFCDK